MRSASIGIVIISAVVIAAVIYGFTVVGSPLHARYLRLDAIRTSNFTTIRYAIESYVSKNQHVPEKLADLDSSNNYGSSLQMKDPETGSEYEYKVVSPSSYQLCTTFSTDSEEEFKNAGSGGAYPDYGSNAEMKHTKGHDCVDFDVESQLYVSNGTMPKAVQDTQPSLDSSDISKQVRDATRITNLTTLKSAISLYLADVENPVLCVSGKVYRSIDGGTAADGTGWLPVNFSKISSGSPLGQLPIDPVNNSAYLYRYACDPTKKTFEIDAKMESQKYGNGGASDVVNTDRGDNTAAYEVGTDLRILH